MENNRKIQDIKEYLKIVFDIEGSLYQNQKMKEIYIKNRNENKPTEPIMEKINQPQKPQLRPENESLFGYFVGIKTQGKQLFNKILFSFSLIITIILSMADFPIIVEIIDVLDGHYFSLNVSFVVKQLIWTALFIALTIFSHKRVKKDYEKQIAALKKENIEKTEHYNKEVVEFRLAQKTLLETYNAKQEMYIEEKEIYDAETQKYISKFEEIQNSLSNTLNNYYSKDLIYPKYRNLIAIATIYEYFASGRCNELEGPNGAYNLYESELRSNIIINSLSQIISDLNQIKNGQYALYEMINSSNAVICEMLNNMNKAQYLTAYFAKEAALAASADRYIVGRTYIW